LAFAVSSPARADEPQYVVAYVEFLPAFKEVGGKLLTSWRPSAAMQKGRLASPPTRKSGEAISMS
jgi:hypothetical protein